MIVFLALLWLGIGAVVGLIANAANLRPASWQTFGWIRMAALGALVAFCGGWLGVLLLGRPFAAMLALWMAVIGVVGIPKLLPRMS
jgi:hypothetical protein